MQTLSKSSMHSDHRAWNSDIEMWSQDVRMWYQELEALRNAMEYIQNAFENHELGIDAHIRSINQHQDLLNKHELDLSLIKESDGFYEELEAVHKREAVKQNAQRAAHERLKRYHHQILVLVKGLKEALQTAV